MKVTVKAVPIEVPLTEAGPELTRSDRLPPLPAQPDALPPRYEAADNGLTLEVGSGRQTFDIDLVPEAGATLE